MSETRPIFTGSDMADLSTVGQIVLACANLGATAARIRQELDVDALRSHCIEALAQLNAGESFGNKRPEEIARVKQAKFRAARGLALSTAALEFLRAYDEINTLEAP